jgi:hypothetical protein
MNIPPTCEWDVTPCTTKGTIWTVLNKTTGKYHTVCSNHLVTVMDPEHTFVIYKARDYSKPKDRPLPSDLEMVKERIASIARNLEDFQKNPNAMFPVIRTNISDHIGELNRSHRLGNWFLDDLDDIYEQAETIMKSKENLPYPFGFQALMLNVCIALGQVRLEFMRQNLPKE